MIPCATWPRALLLAAALLVLVVAPAAAHPGVRGGELPVDSLATMTIATNHGCGTHDEGEEEATTGLALEVPAWLRIVEVPTDGWEVALERDGAGRVVAVTWDTDAPATIAPDVALDVVATGQPGETHDLRVIQTCGELTERWVGTRDEPADQPAVRVELVESPPDALPPPPEATVSGDGATAATATEVTPGDAGVEPTTGEADDLAEDTTEVVAGTADDAALDASPTGADDGGGIGWWLVALVVAAAVVAGIVSWRYRRGGAGA
jgi:uncharacterized protein YcnI